MKNIEEEIQLLWKWYFLLVFALRIDDTAKRLPNIPNIRMTNKQQTHASNFNEDTFDSKEVVFS